MRISSGRLKGKKILLPPSILIKPTEGIVKKSLISILKDHWEGMIFLDLFAGSGAVGLEVYSNGAKEIYFSEKDRRLTECLGRTLREWEIPGRVFTGDCFRHLEYFLRKKITFDAIFLDPPYHKFSYSRLVEKIRLQNILRSPGWLILERHHKSLSLTKEDVSNYHLDLYRARRYGNICIDIYRYRGR